MTLDAFRRRRPTVVELATAYRTAAPVAEAPPAPASPATPEGDDSSIETTFLWEGPIGMENELTGDGRMIQAGALRWEIEPGSSLPFRTVIEDVGAHQGAVVSGSIFSIERRDGGVLWAEGDFDRNSPDGIEARRLVAEDRMTGVSMDLDDVSFEVRIAAEVYDEMQRQMDEFIDLIESGEEPEQPEPERDDDGNVIVHTANSGEEMMVTTDARVRSATQVSVPAFSNARIRLRVGERPQATSAEAVEENAALVASASRIPVEPPRSWFDAPRESDGPFAVRIGDDGRLSGYLATWDVCHVASPAGEGICVTAPRSSTGYAHFHVGALRTKEGEEIEVGTITMNTTHAKQGRDVSGIQASAHYDHTGMAVADVRVGENANGIWVSGAVRPGLSKEKLRVLRASPLSGDWREFGRSLELIAAVAVNTPGFPIPRPAGHVQQGGLRSLVASGMIAPERVIPAGQEGALSESDLTYLRALAQKERTSVVDALANRVALAASKAKIAQFIARNKLTATTSTTTK